MQRLFIPSRGPDDWRRLLADPHRHWRPGKSAYELAVAWEGARDKPGGLPPDVAAVFDRSPPFSKAQLLLGIPEHKVPLRGSGHATQTDLWGLIRCGETVVSMAVEGKAGEPFGERVSEWLGSTPSRRKQRRLDQICGLLSITKEQAHGCRYQLLHRAVAAILEAHRFGLKHALLLVHSFADDPESFADYLRFAEEHRIDAAENAVVPAGLRDGVTLWLGWVSSAPPSVTSSRELNETQRIYFRDQLREARAAALKDAEGFHEILFCLERLRTVLNPHGQGLGALLPSLKELAAGSPLAAVIPRQYPKFHPPMERLFDQVRSGRNDAAHEGAYARHLTEHAVQLAIIIEDALMSKTIKQAQDFMVRDPICAELWEPMSLIRQKMLSNSFSFLPVRSLSGEWKLVSDRALARVLRGVAHAERTRRLAMTLEQALAAGLPLLEEAETCDPTDPVKTVAKGLTDKPVLVVDEEHLLGIITAFDLL